MNLYNPHLIYLPTLLPIPLFIVGFFTEGLVQGLCTLAAWSLFTLSQFNSAWRYLSPGNKKWGVLRCQKCKYWFPYWQGHTHMFRDVVDAQVSSLTSVWVCQTCHEAIEFRLAVADASNHSS